MTRDEIVLRAKRVEALLANPDFCAVLSEVETSILMDIRSTGWDEPAKREVLHAEIRALDRVLTRLRAWADAQHE